MLTLAAGGASAGLTDPPRNATEARARAAVAYRRAHDDAEREIGALLAVLVSSSPPLEVEPRARSAMEAVGMLWETAARLNEHQ